MQSHRLHASTWGPLALGLSLLCARVEAQVPFQRSAGTTGRVALGEIPVNDDCSGALPLLCDSTAIANNSAATTAPEDPGFSCHFSGPGTQGTGTLWYTFVPTSRKIRAHTNGSVFPADDSIIAIYEGTCGAFVELDCSDDEDDGLLSDLTFDDLTAGDTYYLQLACFADPDRGAYMLSLECIPDPPDPPDPDFALEVSPGMAGRTNTLTTRHGTEGGLTAFVFGFRPGDRMIHLRPCPMGITLGMLDPHLAGFATIVDGSSTASVFVPGGLIGVNINMQAIDMASCETSDLVNLTF